MNSPPPPEPLKFDELLTRCMGEVEFAQKILREFLDSSEPLLDQIGSSIEQDSVQEAARTVHRLKGTAATVAAKPFLHALVELEQLLRSEETPQTVALNEKLNRSCLRFEEVKQYAEDCLLD